MVNSNPEIIRLLNRDLFTIDDLSELLAILASDPYAGASIGSHRRSTIWVCCQHSDCYFRRAVIPPLLVRHGADANYKADNGFTPLLSLYRSWKSNKTREDRRQMALVLVHECGATIPYNDAHNTPIDIPGWLRDPPTMNMELLG